MEIKRLAVCILIFCFAFSPTVLAQDTSRAVLNWLATLGSWTLLLWLIGGGLIFFGFIILRPLEQINLFKWFCYIGLFIIFIATFGVEITYILPYLGKPVITFATCEGISTTTPIIQEPINNFVIAIACIFVGNAPADLTGYAIATFFIFGVIAPLGVLIALFYEFTDFLQNKNVRNVMAFLSALMAYRFLLATLFTEILGYGFAGLGLLLVDYFFFMVLLRVIRGLWAGYEATEKALAVEDREILSSLMRRRDDLMHTISVTTDPTMLAAYEADKKAVIKQIKEYEKKTSITKK